MEQIQMVHVDVLHPHEQNPRLDAASVEELTASIREHGIEVPLVAAPETNGTEGYVVLAGHRRLTAAHALSLAEVPVQIRDDLTDPRAQLAFMATENILRDQLTPVEESRLVQDMLDLGMTQAEIATQTALGKKRVAERLKLGRLAEQTGEKVHRGQITLEDALVIAEYSDDPDTAAELEDAAGTYNFDFYTSRAKARREAREKVAAAEKTAKKKRLRIADPDGDFVSLAELTAEGLWTTPELNELAPTDLDDDAWEAALAAAHKDCPGHCVLIRREGYAAGEMVIGCDKVDELHAGTAAGAAATVEAQVEVDPWDELSAEDFEAARINRERHLAAAVPRLDVLDEAMDAATENVLGIGWGPYVESSEGIALLEGITGAAGKAKVRKVLRGLPLQVLVWLAAQPYDLRTSHRFMAEGRPGSSYWGPRSGMRRALAAAGYVPTDVERRACELATGHPWEWDGAEQDTEQGEEGEAA